jgi:hypothetical protein
MRKDNSTSWAIGAYDVYSGRCNGPNSGMPNNVTTLCELNNFSLCVFGEATQGVDQLHLVNRAAAGFEEAR